MERILSLIEHYGYLVILFGVMLESTGVPLPGETILIAFGILGGSLPTSLGWDVYHSHGILLTSLSPRL
jgi:membrane protein DedA with SNARE-associated domain